MTNILAVRHKYSNRSWIVSDRQVTCGSLSFKNHKTKIFKKDNIAICIAGSSILSEYVEFNNNFNEIINESYESEGLRSLFLFKEYNSRIKEFEEEFSIDGLDISLLVLSKNKLFCISSEDSREALYSVGDYYFECIGSSHQFIAGHLIGSMLSKENTYIVDLMK